VNTLAPDAYVNDNRRKIWGTDAIRAFMAQEFVGDHVTMDVREVIDPLRGHRRPGSARRHPRQDQPS
jgi:hypothetical protein